MWASEENAKKRNAPSLNFGSSHPTAIRLSAFYDVWSFSRQIGKIGTKRASRHAVSEKLTLSFRRALQIWPNAASEKIIHYLGMALP